MLPLSEAGASGPLFISSHNFEEALRNLLFNLVQSLSPNFLPLLAHLFVLFGLSRQPFDGFLSLSELPILKFCYLSYSIQLFIGLGDVVFILLLQFLQLAVALTALLFES